MDRTERIAQLHGLLSSHRRGLSYERLMAETGSSRSTLYRDLCFMRDTLGAPLEHEGDPARVWRYVNRNLDAFQLPGVWLSADELYALMLAQQVLKQSGAGLLGQALGPLQPRIQKILGDKANHLDRLLVMRTQARHSNPSVFRIVTEAVLGRLQLRFRYQARSTAEGKGASGLAPAPDPPPRQLVPGRLGSRPIHRAPLRPGPHPPPRTQPPSPPSPSPSPISTPRATPATASSPAPPSPPPSSASPHTPRAGSQTNTGTPGNSNACFPTAAWNSPSPTPTRANC